MRKEDQKKERIENSKTLRVISKQEVKKTVDFPSSLRNRLKTTRRNKKSTNKNIMLSKNIFLNLESFKPIKSKVYWLVCFSKKLDLLYLRLYPADNGPSGITQKFNKNQPWLEIHSKAETETIIHIRKLHGCSFWQKLVLKCKIGTNSISLKLKMNRFIL